MKHVFTIILSLLCLLPDTTWAQKRKEIEVHGSDIFIVREDEDISLFGAKQKCTLKAKIAAIKSAFPEKIDFINTIEEFEKNGEIQSTSFSELCTTYNVEWHDTKKPLICVSYENDELTFKVEVWGKASEIDKPVTSLDWKVLGTDKRETTDFQYNEQLYVTFCPPADGFVAIFLDTMDGDVWCLLPHNKDKDGQHFVKMDTKYTFFDKGREGNVALDTNKEVDHNVLYIIYSPHPFLKPALTSRDYFSSLSKEKFNKWLREMKASPDTVEEHKTLTIRKQQ